MFGGRETCFSPLVVRKSKEMNVSLYRPPQWSFFLSNMPAMDFNKIFFSSRWSHRWWTSMRMTDCLSEHAGDRTQWGWLFVSPNTLMIQPSRAYDYYKFNSQIKLFYLADNICWFFWAGEKLSMKITNNDLGRNGCFSLKIPIYFGAPS